MIWARSTWRPEYQLAGGARKGEHIPIAIRNDTIEYNASAFQVEPNAPVEDLLKKLPGVEVDRQGNIKAQGEQVNKVLVDGKNFSATTPRSPPKTCLPMPWTKSRYSIKNPRWPSFRVLRTGKRKEPSTSHSRTTKNKVTSAM
ncbi:MAG: hypothetical protein IPJ40_02810 [Saprospirales bacterium]|nr:hypothetical protein [Saprospirales bacterium]